MFTKYFYKFLTLIKYHIQLKCKPGIISDIKCNSFINFCFNFSDRSENHLGDILFLLPSILSIQNKYNIKIIASNDILKLMTYFGVNINNNLLEYESIEIAYIWNRRLKYKNYIYLNLTDYRIKEKPSLLLINFLKERGYNLDNKISLQVDNKTPTKYDNRYFIFNNECESGKFRLYFGAKNKLDRFSKHLLEQGMIPICVGVNVKSAIPFTENFIDLRGKTSLTDLVVLINSENLSVVSYDNAIAHLGIIFNVPIVYLSFRYFSKSYTYYLKKCIFPMWYTTTLINYI